jgi:hypothetical protein
MEESIIVIQLRTGEIIITQTDDVDPIDDTNDPMLKVSLPAILIPVPNQPGRVGFQPFFPFSDLDEEQKIRKSQISTLSEPNKQMKDAYDNWVTQVKAQEAGIVPATQMPNDLDTTLKNFNPKQ